MNSTKTLTPDQVAHLKVGVRSALGFGIAVSVAANALEAVSAAAAAHDSQWWLIGSILLAALAPVFAFVCIEFVTRIPVRGLAIAISRLAITFALCGFACKISFGNIAAVAVRLHEASNQHYWPLVIDGMMLVATLSLVALEQYGTHVQAVIEAVQDADAEVAAIAKAAEAVAQAARAKALRAAQKASRTWQNADAGGKRAWTADWSKKYDAEQARIARTAPTSPAPAAQTPVATVTEAQMADAVR